MRVVRNVVTQASVIQQFEHLAELGFDTRAMWKHSIATAQACQYIARNADESSRTRRKSCTRVDCCTTSARS
jgi:hypothetical protein